MTRLDSSGLIFGVPILSRPSGQRERFPKWRGHVASYLIDIEPETVFSFVEWIFLDIPQQMTEAATRNRHCIKDIVCRSPLSMGDISGIRGRFRMLHRIKLNPT